MKFRKVSESVYTREKKLSEKAQLVDDFMKSGISVAMVEDWNKIYKNVDSAYGSIYLFTHKHNPVCKPIMRSGKLYLVNTKLVSK